MRGSNDVEVDGPALGALLVNLFSGVKYGELNFSALHTVHTECKLYSHHLARTSVYSRIRITHQLYS